MKTFWCAVIGLVVSACGASSDLTADEVDALGGGHDATLTQQQTLAVADELFDFDPTLDPTLTAEANAGAISTRATARLPCAAVTSAGASVTVTTPSTGCTTESGVTFSGTVTAAVSKTSAGLTVSLTFTNVVLGGNSVAGTLTLTTNDGSTFSVTYALTRNGKAVGGLLTAVGSPGQISTSGTIDNGSTTAVLTNVVWKKGDCYPSAGSIAVTVGKLTTTYTFTSSTPNTGTVTTGRGKTAQLPSYGACPEGADAGR